MVHKSRKEADRVFESVHFLSFGEGKVKSGELYPMRKSGHGEMLWLHSGCLFICEGYREYRMTAGDVILFDGISSHYGFRESDCASDFTRIVFTGDITQPQNSSSSTSLQCRQFVPAHPERLNDIVSMIRLYHSLPEYPAESIDSVLRLALTELFIDGIPSKDVSPDRLELCGKVCDYIRECNGVIKSGDIASKFGYTQKYLSKLFCARYAHGLKSYIDAVRLAYLKSSLASDMSMLEAAQAAGFDELKPMQDFFRYNTGMTVNEWLNEN